MCVDEKMQEAGKTGTLAIVESGWGEGCWGGKTRVRRKGVCRLLQEAKGLWLPQYPA